MILAKWCTLNRYGGIMRIKQFILSEKWYMVTYTICDERHIKSDPIVSIERMVNNRRERDISIYYNGHIEFRDSYSYSRYSFNIPKFYNIICTILDVLNTSNDGNKFRNLSVSEVISFLYTYLDTYLPKGIYDIEYGSCDEEESKNKYAENVCVINTEDPLVNIGHISGNTFKTDYVIYTGGSVVFRSKGVDMGDMKKLAEISEYITVTSEKSGITRSDSWIYNIILFASKRFDNVMRYVPDKASRKYSFLL